MTRIVRREVDCSEMELSGSGSCPMESLTLNPIESSVPLPESITVSFAGKWKRTETCSHTQSSPVRRQLMLQIRFTMLSLEIILDHY
jgi:hypothetical protein